MRTNGLLTFIALLFLIGCAERKYVVIETDNPPFYENTAFNSFEDLRSPKFERLKTKYQLDTVLRGEEDEFRRILLLRNWIKDVIKIDDFGDPYPGGGTVEGILDEALQGTGFHCGHYMKVQNGIMNAYGYVTRVLGAGPGEKGGRDGHHGVNEIWSNTFQKWFLSDAKYNHHFEKNGIPLSALEIREEYLKNKTADVVVVKGPHREVIQVDPETRDTKEEFAQTYTWLEYFTNSDLFTKGDDHEFLLTVYEDDYFKNNTWIWDGKPHWAYDKPEFMIREPSRHAIEWTPNTIRSAVDISGGKARINLESQTPNFREYQMKAGKSGNWQAVKSPVALPLEEKAYDLTFRAVNLAGVTGPEHTIKIRRE